MHELKQVNLTFLLTLTPIASVVIGWETLDLLIPGWRHRFFDRDTESKDR